MTRPASLTFILFSILNISIWSQSLIKLYEPYLPHKLLQLPDSLTIGVNLENYAAIHPELIYYYIKYLDYFSALKISNPDSNYLNHLLFNKNKYLIEKSKWADNQKNHIAEFTSNKLKRSKMQSFFDNMEYERQSSYKFNPELPGDSNFKEYVQYIYLIKSCERYDSTQDYYVKYKHAVTETILQMNSEFSDFPAYSYDKKTEKILSDINLWYLFGNYLDIKPTYEVSELILKAFNDDYLNKTGYIFSVGYNQTFFRLFEASPYTYMSEKPLPGYLHPVEFKFHPTLYYSASFNFEAGYQFALQPEIGSLSFLKLKIGISLLNAHYALDSTNYRIIYRIISSSEKEVYDYKLGLNDNSSSMFSLYLETPTIYFSRYFFIGLGFNLSAVNVKYSFDVKKQSVRIQEDNEIVLSEEIRKSFDYNELKVSISPVISADYIFQNGIGFQLNCFVLYKEYNMQLSAGYSF